MTTGERGGVVHVRDNVIDAQSRWLTVFRSGFSDRYRSWLRRGTEDGLDIVWVDQNIATGGSRILIVVHNNEIDNKSHQGSRAEHGEERPGVTPQEALLGDVISFDLSPRIQSVSRSISNGWMM